MLKERERDGGFVITRGKKAKMIFTRSLPVNGIEKGEIKEVSKGYARNYLIPYRFAVYATEENRELYKEFTDVIDYLLLLLLIYYCLFQIYNILSYYLSVFIYQEYY